MRRRFAILFVTAFVSMFGAAACAEGEVRKQVEEEVQDAQQQVEEQVQEATQQIEQEAQEVQKQVEEQVGKEQ